MYGYCCIVVYVVAVPILMAFWRLEQADRVRTLPFYQCHSGRLWWDVEDLMYRLLMTGLLLVILERLHLRLVACVLFSLVQHVIVSYFCPYVNRSHNNVAAVGQSIVTLTITAAYVLDTINNRSRAAKRVSAFSYQI